MKKLNWNSIRATITTRVRSGADILPVYSTVSIRAYTGQFYWIESGYALTPSCVRTEIFECDKISKIVILREILKQYN